MTKVINTKIGLWRGKPVENLSKRELLDVIKFMSDEIKNLRKEKKTPEQKAREVLGELPKLPVDVFDLFFNFSGWKDDV